LYFKYFLGETVQLTNEMQNLEICEYMKWDYNTLMQQPQSFIELISIKMESEGYARKFLSKQ